MLGKKRLKTLNLKRESIKSRLSLNVVEPLMVCTNIETGYSQAGI